jgi:outer membrane protein OmpA-like peptidoglycan-associated protein
MKRYINTTFIFILAQNLLFAQNEIPSNDKVFILNEHTINTEGLEYSPTFYENGIVFISTDGKSSKKIFDQRQGKKTSSILIARRGPDGVLSSPEVFASELTTSYNEGPASFDRANETIFYSTNHQKNGKKMKAKDGLVKQKIESAKNKEGKWTDTEDLPFNNVEYSTCHPTISVEGNILYFASNRPDGFGGMDIYMVKKIGDTWGEAVNLGATINSDKDEAFPFIHPNGTLYFASNGKNAIGGFDIFYAKAVNGRFEEAKNLGKPFNSEADDFGFILDLERKNGYFTSNRKGGKGEDDIYSFTTNEKVGDEKKKAEKTITFYTANATNGSNIENVELKILPLSNFEIGDLVTDNDGNIIKLTSVDSTNILTGLPESDAQKINSNAEGKAETKLANGDYLVFVNKKGYLARQTILNINDQRDEFMMLLEANKGEGVAVTGILKNNRGLPIPNATITLTEENGGEPQVIQTDNEGKYAYYVKPKTNYILSATKDNHLAASTKFNSGEISANKEKPAELPIKLEMAELTSPLPTGKIFQLNNVYYNYNDATLRPDAKKDLDPLVSLLKSYPEVEIELASHTDSRGKADFNFQLSQRRAESVVKYLTDRGISRNRLVASGYGESQLKNQCKDGVSCSEAEHQVNRRTEVRVVKGGNDLTPEMIDKTFTGNHLSDATKNSSNTASTSTTNNNVNTKPNSFGKSNPTKNTNSGTSTIGDGKNQNSNSNNNTTNADVINPSKNPKVKIVPNDPTTQTANTNPTSVSGGTYWVVAGSYQDPKNADNQLAKLINKGYQDALIIYAEDIRFYRVVVKFVPTLSEAQSLYRKLKQQKEAAFLLRAMN